MKKVLRFVLMLSIISLTLFISACSNSYDEMIDNFNHKYFSPERPEQDVYSVTSREFNPDAMLEEYYTFKKGYYVNLEAPANAASYRWSYSEITDEDNLITLSQKRYLYLNTSDAFNSSEASHSFKLVLAITVTGVEGAVREYIDTSTITIIDQNKAGHGGF